MIDFNNRETLITIKTALIRALNSIDNEIGEINADYFHNRVSGSQYRAKRLELDRSKADMTAIYNEMDKAIDDALTVLPNVHY